MPEVAELEPVQTLEQVASVEKEAVSETPVVTKVEPEVELTPEILSRIQAEADKRVNPYREKREADTALLRKQDKELKELKSAMSIKGLTKLTESVIAGDVEEGVEEDKISARKIALDKINEKIKEYNEQSSAVAEAASLASGVAEKVDKKIIDHFDLTDTNPAVRAKGIASLVSEAVSWINEKEAFNKILEEIPLLQKGSEVRQQIDGFIEQYLEPSLGEKGKDLLIKQLKQEFRVTPKKKPQEPSDVAGGDDLSNLSPREKIDRGIELAKLKKK